MRITTHGNDLLITDQSLGFGAFLVTMGAFLVVSALSRFLGDDPLQVMTFVSLAAGAYAIKMGMARLVATQLIVDLDEKLVITRRWSILKTDNQRIPFDAVLGFDITPDGQEKGTSLSIRTTRGDVPASGGAKAVRAAWVEVIDAIEVHMGRKARPDENSDEKAPRADRYDP